MTTIADDKAVLIHYILTGDDGQVIDRSTDAPLAYLHGRGNLIPGLEAALVGAAAGSQHKVTIAPEDAYGVADPEAVQKVHRSEFPKDFDPKPGMPIHAQTSDGRMIQLWVTEVVGAYVTLTMNHPLAGKTLHFEVEVVDVRDATPEELAHGHVHGPHGHHH